MSREIIAQALGRISAFAGVDEAVLVRLAQYTKIAKVPAGVTVFRAGDPADRFFILLSGEVGIYAGNPEQSPAGVVQAGGIFGAAPLLDGAPHPATAVTLQESLVLFLLRQDIERLALSYPGLAFALNQRLRSADACAQALVRRAAPAAPLPEELYYKEYTCPVCGERLSSPAVKSRFLRVTRTDTDFCQYYEGPNPLFYDVVLCPTCGYAFSEESHESLNPQTQKALRDFCAGQEKREYAVPRTLDDALELFRRAIACQEARGARPSIRARLYLKLAWLYRYRGDTAGEQEALAAALRHFTEAFQLEQAGDPKQELNLLYLIGELNRRLGRADEAIRWFGRVINHPAKERNRLVLNMARDRWQEIRSERK